MLRSYLRYGLPFWFRLSALAAFLPPVWLAVLVEIVSTCWVLTSGAACRSGGDRHHLLHSYLRYGLPFWSRSSALAAFLPPIWLAVLVEQELLKVPRDVIVGDWRKVEASGVA